ncbi:hypothetical protein COP1_014688 [Malus domestica]
MAFLMQLLMLIAHQLPSHQYVRRSVMHLGCGMCLSILSRHKDTSDHFIISVEDRVDPGRDDIIRRVILPLNIVDRHADDRMIHSRWFNLEKPVAVDIYQLKMDKFSSHLHLRVCLDGGYHVLDEATHYSSDSSPTAKQLWGLSVGSES